MANYTPNYQLHQWEPEDPFLRTDFNEDLQKIDTALNGLAGDLAQKAAQSDLDEVRALATQSRFTKLKEFSFPSQTTKIQIDLSDIDWSQWDKIHLDGIPTNGSQMLVYFNTVGTSKFYLLGYANRYMPRMTFEVGFQPDRAVFARFGEQVVADSITYTALKKIIIGGGTMPEGSYFSVWGEV